MTERDQHEVAAARALSKARELELIAPVEAGWLPHDEEAALEAMGEVLRAAQDEADDSIDGAEGRVTLDQHARVIEAMADEEQRRKRAESELEAARELLARWAKWINKDPWQARGERVYEIERDTHRELLRESGRAEQQTTRGEDSK